MILMTAGKTRCKYCKYYGNKVTENPCKCCSEIQTKLNSKDNYFIDNRVEFIQEESEK